MLAPLLQRTPLLLQPVVEGGKHKREGQPYSMPTCSWLHQPLPPEQELTYTREAWIHVGGLRLQDKPAWDTLLLSTFLHWGPNLVMGLGGQSKVTQGTE